MAVPWKRDLRFRPDFGENSPLCIDIEEVVHPFEVCSDLDDFDNSHCKYFLQNDHYLTNDLL